MARFSLTGRPVASEIEAVTMVQPALGPSLGVAPSGTCKWMRLSNKKRVIRVDILQKDLGKGVGNSDAFFHHVSEVSREFNSAFAFGLFVRPCALLNCFDVQSGPSVRRPGQPHAHSGRSALIHLVFRKQGLANVRLQVIFVNDNSLSLFFSLE